MICEHVYGIDQSADVTKPRPRKARQPRPALAGAWPSLKEMVIRARSNAGHNDAGRGRQAVVQTLKQSIEQSRRLLTGQGGDEDVWIPAPSDAKLAVQQADTERRCTRQRKKDLSVVSLSCISEPVSAAPTAAAEPAPDLGSLPGMGGASTPSDYSHETPASNGAAPGAAPAAIPEHVFATAGSDSDGDEADIPLQKRILDLKGKPGEEVAVTEPVYADATSEGCNVDSVVPVPAAAAPPARGKCKPSESGGRSCGSGWRQRGQCTNKSLKRRFG